jgi:DNA helicase-2/ATP-dependent DNA helicase PcrA
MTIHASKGLEFDYVFIVGLEQDLFPHKPSESKKGSRDNEEERRLFYVALTRARLKLFLTYANMRTIFGSRQVGVPSEFIFDVPEEYTEKTERFEGRKKVIYFDI